MKLSEAETFQSYLENEFSERCRRNSRYSQRAFARDLDIPPHRLGEILRSKVGISRRRAEAIAERLGLSKSETEIFCDLVDKSCARTPAMRVKAQQRIESRKQGSTTANRISEDQFQLMHHWYYLAIVEYLQTRPDPVDISTIAKLFGLPLGQARIALETLVRLKFLKSEGKIYKVIAPNLVIEGGIPSNSIKAFHEQILSRARESLFSEPIDQREFNTSVIAIPMTKLPKAKEKIQAFWTDFFKEFNDYSHDADDVFALSTQLFRLSRSENLKSKTKEL